MADDNIPPSTPDPSDPSITDVAAITVTAPRSSALPVSLGRNSNRFDLNAFRTEIMTRGEMPRHSFLVSFAPIGRNGQGKLAESLNRTMKNTPSLISLRCDSFSRPEGLSLNTSAFNRHGYGPFELVATGGISPQPLSTRWIPDRNGRLVAFFHDWLSLATNFSSKGTADMTTKNKFSYSPYEVGYKDDYACSRMTVTQYDRSQNTVVIYSFYDVFPIAISYAENSWETRDSSDSLGISLAYTDFDVSTPQVIDSPIADLFAEVSLAIKNPFNLENDQRILDSLTSIFPKL